MLVDTPIIEMKFSEIALSFTAGLSAAMSPCVIILIPLLLTKVSGMKGNKFVQMPILLFGFLATFVSLGFFLKQLMESSFQSGFRLGLGLFFVTLGCQSFFGKVTNFTFPLLDNPLVMGGIFSILVCNSYQFIDIVVKISFKSIIFKSIGYI